MKDIIPLLVALAFAANVQAKFIRVNDNAPPGGDGSSWGTAHKHLQDALAAASTGDELWVAEGTYKPDQGLGKTIGDRTASFVLANGVRLYGGFRGTEIARNPLGDNNKTILSGEIDGNSSLWSLHVVTGNELDTSTIVSSFRITKGNANGNNDDAMGGGVFLAQSSPKFANCVITENLANIYGGGMYNQDSSPSLVQCVFAHNSATHGGGGIYNSRGRAQDLFFSYPMLGNCVFLGNSAIRGGGLYNDSSSSTINNSVFADNQSDYRGGGVYNTGSSPTINNCAFTGNSAIKGGALYTTTGSTTIQNSIFHKNTTGIEVGHGIEGGWSNGAQIQLVSSAGANGGEAVYVTIPGANNLIQGGDKGTEAEIDADPLFVNLDVPVGHDGKWFTEDDGLRLTADSPAIDTGSEKYLSSDETDLDGDGNRTEKTPFGMARFKRVQNGAVDLGPYEYGEEKAVTLPKVTINVGSSPSAGGAVSGGGSIGINEATSLTATPSTGYLFTGWSGDATGMVNPLHINVSGGMDVMANFAQDLNDMDGDGLTNYAELVTHGTKTDDNDTDDDGLLDNQEVQFETNPTWANPGLKNFIDAVALSEGRAIGIAAVKATPSDYGLFDTSSDLNASVTAAIAEARSAALEEGRVAGIAEVQENQTQYGIFSKSDIEDALATGLSEGRTAGLQEGQDAGVETVKAKPTDYGLYSHADLNASVVGERAKARNSALVEGEETGIALVVKNPNQYGLLTTDDLNTSVAAAQTAAESAGRIAGVKEGRSAGIEAVQANPAYYSLYTSADLNASVVTLLESTKSSALEKGKATGIEEGRSAGIEAVTGNPASYGLAAVQVLEATGTTPYTDGWYYQPKWGWLWTNPKTFPYVYRSSPDGETSSWLYFREGTSSPAYFYSYAAQKWETLGESP